MCNIFANFAATFSVTAGTQVAKAAKLPERLPNDERNRALEGIMMVVAREKSFKDAFCLMKARG